MKSIENYSTKLSLRTSRNGRIVIFKMAPTNRDKYSFKERCKDIIQILKGNRKALELSVFTTKARSLGGYLLNLD